jgi:hypothetical protein
MKIRGLKWRGLPMWPPEWRFSDQGVGEEGVLEAVTLRVDLQPKLISIVANHRGDIRKGVMLMDELTHLEALYSTLRRNVGRPLREIGDLEINLLAPLPKRGPRQSRPLAPLRQKSAME